LSRALEEFLQIVNPTWERIARSIPVLTVSLPGGERGGARREALPP